MNMRRRILNSLITLLDWALRPLAANIIGSLVLVTLGIWIGAPAYVNLLNGGGLTDRVFTGMVRDGRDVYWHVWYLVILSTGIVISGLFVLYGYEDGRRHWNRWFLRQFNRRKRTG